MSSTNTAHGGSSGGLRRLIFPLSRGGSAACEQKGSVYEIISRHLNCVGARQADTAPWDSASLHFGPEATINPKIQHFPFRSAQGSAVPDLSLRGAQNSDNDTHATQSPGISGMMYVPTEANTAEEDQQSREYADGKLFWRDTSDGTERIRAISRVAASIAPGVDGQYTAHFTYKNRAMTLEGMREYKGDDWVAGEAFGCSGVEEKGEDDKTDDEQEAGDEEIPWQRDRRYVRALRSEIAAFKALPLVD